jgi:hypothetical protein
MRLSGEKEKLMGVFPILQKNQKQRACLANKNLPADYMSDYSVLGLVVGRLDTALRVLEEKKFEVRKKTDSFEITIDSVARMSEVLNLLNQNGIDYVLSDIVDQLYQG